ncbi:MAG: lyase domain protein repeat-containing protein [Bryobacterales bacterium]|nr:lyase domain protein repeat-containing protein [Bryobacterales bacterium]
MKTATLSLMLGACLWAQQPQIENARLESHNFTGTLEAQLSQLGSGPFWAGYAQKMIAGNHGDGCWTNSDNGGGRSPNAPVRLEGQTVMVVLVRVEAGQIDKLQTTSPDCRLDGGGLPFHWFNNVPAAASVAWLKSQVLSEKGDRTIYPLAMHPGPEADRALDELTAATQPEKIRERTAFWLGNTRGQHGIDSLKRMLASDPSVKVREQVVFALSNSRQPAGMAVVFEAAKNDKTPQIRSKALFWIAQKAAAREAQQVIGKAIADDPDRGVKEQAVFALKNLPDDQGVPMLIDVAKSNPDPAVRKKAMFWLGQSKDARALDFFASVLKQ